MPILSLNKSGQFSQIGFAGELPENKTWLEDAQKYGLAEYYQYDFGSFSAGSIDFVDYADKVPAKLTLKQIRYFPIRKNPNYSGGYAIKYGSDGEQPSSVSISSLYGRIGVEGIDMWSKGRMAPVGDSLEYQCSLYTNPETKQYLQPDQMFDIILFTVRASAPHQFYGITWEGHDEFFWTRVNLGAAETPKVSTPTKIIESALPPEEILVHSPVIAEPVIQPVASPEIQKALWDLEHPISKYIQRKA